MKTKQILLPIIVSLFLMSTVLALGTSIRGNGGDIYNIGNDYYPTPSKIQFSAWSRDAVSQNNGIQGEGSISVTAKTWDNKRIVLNVNFEEIYSYKSSNYIYAICSGKGTYWKTGEGLQKINEQIFYFYNRNTGLTSIQGWGDKYFYVYNIKTTQLK